MCVIVKSCSNCMAVDTINWDCGCYKEYRVRFLILIFFAPSTAIEDEIDIAYSTASDDIRSLPKLHLDTN